ncbi:MAG: cob(I)yrinic acid a,c-diamide adenosyltransferase [Actinomycetota bacterium]|nr:cob(I)yrinic acid a,c-diamide adenosyltransferase [Actinomycetota bacterium]
MKVYTKKGDDGTTGLFYGGRTSKADLAPEAYGTVDEAVATLGLARAEAAGELAERLLALQRDLFVVAAELATGPENRHKLEEGVSRPTVEMVARLEGWIDEVEAEVGLPREFVVPGQARLPATLDLARTVIRRAERRAVDCATAGMLEGSQVIPYLNRLGDYVYMLARAAEGEWQPSRIEDGR